MSCALFSWKSGLFGYFELPTKISFQYNSHAWQVNDSAIASLPRLFTYTFGCLDEQKKDAQHGGRVARLKFIGSTDYDSQIACMTPARNYRSNAEMRTILEKIAK
jgi:hypothetical protein